MKELKITIAGASGTGKSTIAATIAAILLEAGFDVTLDDLDVDIDGLGEYIGPKMKPKIEALKRATSILVETKQVGYEPTDVQRVSH